MDNTLEYIDNLPSEIKLIIYSKLSVDALHKVKLPETFSETIFSYRYPETYLKFKNIIKVNRQLEFDDFTTEGPYFWSMLLRDELIREAEEVTYHNKSEPLTPYMNIISIDMHCLSLFYDKYPTLYKYLNIFEYQVEICLFVDAIQKSRVSYINDVISGKVLILDSDDFYDLDIDSIVLIYFFQHFVPKHLLDINYRALDEMLDTILIEGIDMYRSIAEKYNRYDAIYNKYRKYINQHK